MNARYGAMYYSISSTLNNVQTNMSNWMSTCGTGTAGGCANVTPGGQTFCAPELVVAGQYPNSRYFSISNYDEHYTIAQHIADLDVDPLSASKASPFQPGGTFSTTASYAVPVSLGQIPAAGTGVGSGGAMPGCQITPYEQDNLLDGTQRHPAGDWNTQVTGSFPSANHITDNPQHTTPPNPSGSNPAGSIHVRAYLAPPYTCVAGGTVGPNGTLNCSLPCSSDFPGSCVNNGTSSNFGDTYYLVRDTFTGCAYTSSWVGGTMT
jgi:hypothetical protein